MAAEECVKLASINMRTCSGLPERPCGTFMSAVDTDPHTLCPHSTTLDLSEDRSRSPSVEGRPLGLPDLSPSRPAVLPSPFKDADPVIVQAPVPSGHKRLERKTVPQSLKRQAPPARRLAAVPDLVPLHSVACVCAPAPVLTHQCPPARPRSPARPPAVPVIARQRSPAHMRSSACQRPPAAPATALKRSPIRQRSPVPQRTSGIKRTATVPDTARKRSPARQRSPTFQRAVQEVPKLAHGRSQVPLLSSSKLRTPVRPNPVARHARPTQQRTPERPSPVAHPALPSQQHTPVGPNPVARPVRPSQQHTPLRLHPDARHAHP
ncbi:uncharacterized protein [Palaemon carinicauda]|uniref:uncharacterized protein n=1 Tax=Palaemon carinicauda TaxID=392227 RepID=UPI0035B69F1A